MKINREIALSAYLQCALWSSVDSEGNPLDENYDVDDLDAHVKGCLLAEFNDFCDSAECVPYDDYVSDAQLGYDFWLTRNGHGAGFWDGDWGTIGNELTELSKPYGAIDLIAHNGKIYY